MTVVTAYGVFFNAYLPDLPPLDRLISVEALEGLMQRNPTFVPVFS